MKLIQLKIFRDIAHTSSFVKAARMNFITQPSVSSHIKKLEEELQVRLFDRVPRKVILTQEGKLYLEHADEILNKCDNFLALTADFKNSVKGVIRVASIYSIGMYQLGPFLKKFMQQYPRIEIHLEYQDSFNVYELVKNRKVNLGMVAYPKEKTKVKQTTYGKDELVLIVPANHYLANSSKINLKAISNESFVAFDPNTPTRKRIDAFLKENNVSVNIKMVNNNIFALKKAVEVGIGISIVPSSTIVDELLRGTIRQVKITNFELYRPLVFLTAKGGEVRAIEKLFMDSLISHCNQQLEIL